MPKAKGTPGGNRNPVQTDEFKAKQYKRQGDIEGELAKKAVSVKLPKDTDRAVRSLPHMAAWLRRVITEAAKRELMGGEK